VRISSDVFFGEVYADLIEISQSPPTTAAPKDAAKP
jgi:hypothetical protein